MVWRLYCFNTDFLAIYFWIHSDFMNRQTGTCTYAAEKSNYYYSGKAGGVMWSIILSFCEQDNSNGRRPNMVGIGKRWPSTTD